MAPRNPREEVNARREQLIAQYEHYADLGLGIHAEMLRAGGPVPEPLTEAPMIIDTDIGGDPDDAVALLVAALRVPSLRLVLTCDEYRGERARFARHLLDLAGRSDVTVIAGRQLGEQPPRQFCVSDLTPARIATQSGDAADEVAAVCAASPGAVRWVGMGPMSNLADLLAVRPELAQRLAVTQMGGALNYRDPTRAEHNFRLDPPAVRTALGAVHRPNLVTSEVTFRPEMTLTPDSPEYRLLLRPDAPAWAGVLAAHCDRWFDRFYPGTMQHDVLTLSVAMQLPFVHLDLLDIAVDDAARTTEPDPGTPGCVYRCFVSARANYAAFRRWLERQLTSGPAYM
jgi:pyrimidine-specific ribonucleoside hydrolase